MKRPVPYESIPNGWYAVAESRELTKGRVVERRYFDRELVVYRTDSGVAYVRDAYCPHLGAHLGDGCVVGERLRCAFHGFEFDGSGACVSTPYGKRPPARAKLGSFPVVEQDGFVFAWYHAEGAPPHHALPTLPGEGFTPFRYGSLRFRGHPQEVSENSSDIGHFMPVHAYANAVMLGEAEVDGAVLKSRYRVSRKLDFIGLPFDADLEFSAEVHGLGYSFVHAAVEMVKLDVHLLVLPVPITADQLELRVALRLRAPFPGPVRDGVREFIYHAFLGDLKKDIPFWNRKRYIDQPALAEGDGPIGTYRRYARQFYSTPAESGRVALPVVQGRARDAAE